MRMEPSGTGLVPSQEETQSPLPLCLPREDTAGRCRLRTRKRVPAGRQTCHHLGLGLPSLHNGEKHVFVA